ncbi:MAG: hypothetical protein ACD_73C00773G0001 [uncultured bacterium]|nr:MAG: hypothetical protein ACD_73C00773G0001 [uncultured bacterium]
MKKFAFVLGLGLLSLFFINDAKADGCYLCSGGGYVAYTGDDTFDKRKKAKEQLSCQVSGTTSSCSNPKGTVSSHFKPNPKLAINK